MKKLLLSACICAFVSASVNAQSAKTTNSHEQVKKTLAQKKALEAEMQKKKMQMDKDAQLKSAETKQKQTDKTRDAKMKNEAANAEKKRNENEKAASLVDDRNN